MQCRARSHEMTKFQKTLWTGLFILALLTPLGIILPKKFNAEGAWGEWRTETLEKILGYVPAGLKRWANLWKAPIPNYNFSSKDATSTAQVISYVLSGLLGIAIVCLGFYAISRLILRNKK